MYCSVKNVAVLDTFWNWILESSVKSLVKRCSDRRATTVQLVTHLILCEVIILACGSWRFVGGAFLGAQCSALTAQVAKAYVVPEINNHQLTSRLLYFTHPVHYPRQNNGRPPHWRASKMKPLGCSKVYNSDQRSCSNVFKRVQGHVVVFSSMGEQGHINMASWRSPVFGQQHECW